MKRVYESMPKSHSWFQWCESLLELYETKKQFMVGKQYHAVSHLQMDKWILAHKHTGIDFLCSTLLLDSIVSADKNPGAGSYVPWFLYNDFEKKNKKRYSSEIYLNLCLDIIQNENTKKLFREVFDLAGPLTKLAIKESNEIDTVIRARTSFDFNLTLPSTFVNMVGNNDYIDLSNPLVIMIEGAPETIGEINSLLEYNHKSKRPIVLIARNFPEEIIATLGTNWIKNSLSILPFVYGDKLETINLAADICAITKGELISPHFGDAISVAILDQSKWGDVEKCTYRHANLSLYKNVDVSNHVSKLVAKSKESESEELKDLLNDRIISLSNDALEIWVNKENTEIIEEIDALFKHYAAFVTSGAVETSCGILPASFVDAAQDAANSFKEEILNMGGFLVRANDEMVVG